MAQVSSTADGVAPPAANALLSASVDAPAAALAGGDDTAPGELASTSPGPAAGSLLAPPTASAVPSNASAHPPPLIGGPAGPTALADPVAAANDSSPAPTAVSGADALPTVDQVLLSAPAASGSGSGGSSSDEGRGSSSGRKVLRMNSSGLEPDKETLEMASLLSSVSESPGPGGPLSPALAAGPLSPGLAAEDYKVIRSESAPVSALNAGATADPGSVAVISPGDESVVVDVVSDFASPGGRSTKSPGPMKQQARLNQALVPVGQGSLVGGPLNQGNFGVPLGQGSLIGGPGGIIDIPGRNESPGVEAAAIMATMMPPSGASGLPMGTGPSDVMWRQHVMRLQAECDEKSQVIQNLLMKIQDALETINMQGEQLQEWKKFFQQAQAMQDNALHPQQDGTLMSDPSLPGATADMPPLADPGVHVVGLPPLPPLCEKSIVSTLTAPAQMHLQVLDHPPGTAVYQRILRPFPVVAVLGIPPTNTTTFYVEASLMKKNMSQPDEAAVSVTGPVALGGRSSAAAYQGARQNGTFQNMLAGQLLVRADPTLPPQQQQQQLPSGDKSGGSQTLYSVFKKLKILTTTAQQGGSFFLIKFTLKRYVNNELEEVPGVAAAMCNPIEVFSHTLYLKSRPGVSGSSDGAKGGERPKKVARTGQADAAASIVKQEEGKP